MKSCPYAARVAIFSAVVAAGACAALAASAQGPAPFTPPRIGPGPGQAVANLPDWNGSWDNMREVGRAMFDPRHVHIETDPGEGLDFGPVGGSYLTEIPLNPKSMKEYKDRVAQQKAGGATDTVGVGCRPYGMPRVMGPTPRGPIFVIAPQMIAMILGDETRRIFMDGRGHPTGAAAVDSWEGHSIGHWEGDTLVIDTVNIFEGNYDQSDARHSNKIHVVERIRQTDANTLENQITITDPETLTRPWVVTRVYKRSRERWPAVLGSNCGAKEQVEMVNGVQRQKLPFE